MEKVEIVVNTCNRDDDLRRCLESLKKQTYGNFEIVVIDNGESKVAEIYTKKVIRDKTKKLSYLFNLGWKNTKSRIIAYIADDAEAEPDWLENIIRTFEEIPEIGAVSGPVISTCYPAGEMHRLYLASQSNWFLRKLTKPYFYFVYENKILEPGKLCGSGAYTIGAGLAQSKNIKGPIEIDLLTTTNMGIRRDVLERLNGFDEYFNFNHADGDLFVRMKRTGYKLIFNPKIVVKHYVRMGPSRSSYFIGRDTSYFYLKDLRPKLFKDKIAMAANILFLNSYWVYSALANRDSSQLRGIIGFLNGFKEYLYNKKNEK